jgi:methylenetetrahydrofolate reductase (NADPH)
MRSSGKAFHIAVAVSPFKYVESDCLWQYIKLAKKIDAGADLAITQVGWDARKFLELKRWLDERGLSIPLLGNVYVLGPKTAERMATGQPPGCWVSPELLEVVRRESASKDGGLRARLERAARTVAVLRGLGYAGAYIGGTHEPEHIAWIMRRANDLAPRADELAAELSFGARGGFYVYPSTPGGDGGGAGSVAPPRLVGRRLRHLPTSNVGVTPPAPPPSAPSAGAHVVPRTLDLLARLFPVSRETRLRRTLGTVFRWIDRRPRFARGVEKVELAIKKPAFGCEACGTCVLSWLQYVCPQTCPKQMRNGPCGGTAFGRCEVVDKPCIWGAVYERAKAADQISTLRTYVPPPDRSLQGTSSWINYFLERDSRPRSES